MTDFHSHVLPEMDDGSRNLETSVRMIEESGRQGVRLMAATPHFYADREAMDGFLERRAAAAARLEGALDGRGPRLALGAEVAFFPGISRAARVDELTLGGGRALLLEMPFRDWTDADLSEVEWLVRGRGLFVMLAHVERFMARRNMGAVERAFRAGAVAQVNAGALADRRRAKRLAGLFESGRARFLGSDCHGMGRRPPNMAEGARALEAALGSRAWERMKKENEEFFLEATGG